MEQNSDAMVLDLKSIKKIERIKQEIAALYSENQSNMKLYDIQDMLTDLEVEIVMSQVFRHLGY